MLSAIIRFFTRKPSRVAEVEAKFQAYVSATVDELDGIETAQGAAADRFEDVAEWYLAKAKAANAEAYAAYSLSSKLHKHV